MLLLRIHKILHLVKMFKSGTFKCYKNSLDVHFNEGECGGCGGEFPAVQVFTGKCSVFTDEEP